MRSSILIKRQHKYEFNCSWGCFADHSVKLLLYVLIFILVTEMCRIKSFVSDLTSFHTSENILNTYVVIVFVKNRKSNIYILYSDQKQCFPKRAEIIGYKSVRGLVASRSRRTPRPRPRHDTASTCSRVRDRGSKCDICRGATLTDVILYSFAEHFPNSYIIVWTFKPH